jgi:hypothetical protein
MFLRAAGNEIIYLHLTFACFSVFIYSFLFLRMIYGYFYNQKATASILKCMPAVALSLHGARTFHLRTIVFVYQIVDIQ